LEWRTANANENVCAEELFRKTGERVELRVSKQFNEVFAVSGNNVVALQMQCNVSERVGVAVDVQGPQVTSSTRIVMQLLPKELREV
jgi:hypothetical protein